MVWFWIHKLGQSVTISLKWCGQEMCHVPCAQCPVPMTLETSNLNTVILRLVLVWLLMELLVADSQVTTINLSNWILSYFRWSKTVFFFFFIEQISIQQQRRDKTQNSNHVLWIFSTTLFSNFLFLFYHRLWPLFYDINVINTFS